MLKQVSRPKHQRQREQRGAVMILFGLTMVVLIGFAGLAIDLGRAFVIKTELQNAMDACALSAASQLRPGLNTRADLTRAVAYGLVFTTGGTTGTEVFKNSIRNKANFQSTTVNLVDSDITFASAINGPYATAGTDNVNARYAKCDFPLTGLPIYFMKVHNLWGASFTDLTVSAMAVATRGPQICNLIPVGICPRAGIQVGDWLELGDGSGGPTRGWFRWVQFDGNSGNNVLRDNLLNTGSCNLPTNVTEKTGNIGDAMKAWNTRFGIYEGGYLIGEAPPDKTGYSFFNHSVLPVASRNWNVPDNNPGVAPFSPRALPVFNIGETSPNFWNYTNSFSANPGPISTDPAIFSGSPTLATSGVNGTHNTSGLINRRLVIVSTMTNCASGTAVGNGFACALMLNPFGKVGSNDINGKIEYLGPLGPSSPCGNGTVVSPNMSVLVK